MARVVRNSQNSGEERRCETVIPSKTIHSLKALGVFGVELPQVL